MSAPTPVSPDELRALADTEAHELGREPVDGPELARWRDERRGAAVLLAAVADWDPTVILRALTQAPYELQDHVVELLLVATEECERPARRCRRHSSNYRPAR